MAVEDKRSWFVFEVELDGRTKISRGSAKTRGGGSRGIALIVG